MKNLITQDEFFNNVRRISKKSKRVIYTGSRDGNSALYRISSNQEGALAALAIIGSMINNQEAYDSVGLYQHVHVWRLTDGCQMCNGTEPVYGIQFNSLFAIYYFVLVGSELFSKDRVVQDLAAHILKDLTGK